ncbi:hypothetical protein PR002_g15416 [Phytophthora rubi]|uniref:Uncharacterized protein n=1 Tax=Phytophthora rubi TaxID=129364 RepID=A0A6A3L3I7_9STRA|nr:hypothetical protein PR002_g15416 [Phytophthora rubi]
MSLILPAATSTPLAVSRTSAPLTPMPTALLQLAAAAGGERSHSARRLHVADGFNGAVHACIGCFDATCAQTWYWHPACTRSRSSTGFHLRHSSWRDIGGHARRPRSLRPSPLLL